MSLKREIEIFDKVGISADTGETDVWDRVIFPNTIRAREIELILNLAEKVQPRRVLDFGCGSGWVSRALAARGYQVTGIDTSDWLIKSAWRASAGKSQFTVGDCMNLPFGDGSFDLLVGMAILHHLAPERGLAECYRVLTPGGSLLLMEPNKFNPLAALARKFMPVDTQTPDEEPFAPGDLKAQMRQGGWHINRFGYLFPYSFGLSQLLRKTKMDWFLWKPACMPIKFSEMVFERIPLLNKLCWVIVVEAEKVDNG
ncbi:MAG: class I SAM-dependent methyltransferase [Dehalococcoidia bacterium]